MRGSRQHLAHTHSLSRSIPACAGEPSARLLSNLLRGVYPRVCGGAKQCRREMTLWAGLSPRVRGSQSLESLNDVSPRSIPACAGEPTPDASRMRTGTVYPRVCGGAVSAKTRLNSGIGLSPRVRGSHARASAFVVERRSIPACAGEPAELDALDLGIEVYPRVCGGAVS